MSFSIFFILEENLIFAYPVNDYSLEDTSLFHRIYT